MPKCLTLCWFFVQLDEDEFSDSEEDDEPDDVKRSQCTLPNLLQWHERLKEDTSKSETQNNRLPPNKLVVIFPDFESFSSKVVQDVILILR